MKTLFYTLLAIGILAIGIALKMLLAADKDEGNGLVASILPISGLDDIGALRYYDAGEAWSNRHPIAVTNASDADIEFSAHTIGPHVTFEFRDSSGSIYFVEALTNDGSGKFQRYRIAPDEAVLIYAPLNVDTIPADLMREMQNGVKVFDVRVSFIWAGQTVKSEWRAANVYKNQ